MVVQWARRAQRKCRGLSREEERGRSSEPRGQLGLTDDQKQENMTGEGPQQAAISRRIHHYPRAREMNQPVRESD
jgi:hypothetical protein